MTTFQDFGRYGDKLAFVVGRPAAFGVPIDRGRPENVTLAINHALHVRLDVVIDLDGNTCAEIRITSDVAVPVLTSPFGVACRMDESTQLFALDSVRFRCKTSNRLQARTENI